MVDKTYIDFDLQIERAGDGYRAQVLDSPGGQAQADVVVPFSDVELENFVLRVGQRRRGRRRIESHDLDVARDFGAALFQAIIHDDVAGAYRSSVLWAQTHGVGLRLRLRLSGAPGLIDIPWEFLFDRSARRFVALSIDSPIVRFLDIPGVTSPLAIEPPIKILAVIASPTDFEPLQVEDEWARLQEVANSVPGLSIERLEKPTLSELQRALRREFHILHFVGHGGFDEKTQDGLLVFEDEQGRGNEVSATYLATLLHDADTLRLAVLNACDGARASRTDQFSGVAQSLLQQGVPAVVAMQFEISDDAALTFAKEFYGAFAEGLPVEAALAEARKSMFAQQNDSEWATPVLYLRSVGSDIFEISKPATPESGTPNYPKPPIEPVQPVADLIKAAHASAGGADSDALAAETTARDSSTPHQEPPEVRTAPDTAPRETVPEAGDPASGWWRGSPRTRVAVGAGAVAAACVLIAIIFIATRGGGETDDDGGDVTAVVEDTSDFGGTWYTNFARVEMEQSAAEVTGEYTRYLANDRTQTIKGSVTGNNLTGTFAGTSPLNFTMGGDNESFEGYWVDVDGNLQQWCGSRDVRQLFDGCGYSGGWKVKGFPDAAGNTAGDVTMVQTEDVVEVSFASREYGAVDFTAVFAPAKLANARGTAKLEGPGLPTIEIAFEWTVTAPDWNAFTGTWQLPNSRVPGTWCGWRGDATPPC